MADIPEGFELVHSGIPEGFEIVAPEPATSQEQSQAPQKPGFFEEVVAPIFAPASEFAAAVNRGPRAGEWRRSQSGRCHQSR